MAIGEHSEAVVVAFASFVDSSGVTWHATIRDGATKKKIDAMFDLCVYATQSAQERAFDPLSEDNEFGKRLRISELAGYRARRLEQEQRAANRPKKNGASQTSTPPATRTSGAPPRQNGGGQTPHCDIKKSPLSVARLLIQGTTEDPKVVMHSPHTGLKHPLFTVSSSVVVAVIVGWYAVEQDSLDSLSVVGTGMKVDWLVHWVPSPKNPNWKDIVDILIPKLATVRRKERLLAQANPDYAPDEFIDIPF